MRINVRENPRLARRTDMYLDGERLDLCFEADDEAGYALCYQRDTQDKYARLATELVDGQKQLVVVRHEGRVIFVHED